MKRLIAAFALLFSLSSAAFATAQFPETLLFDGQKVSLFTNPLDGYLKDPAHAARLKPYLHEKRCTASWRGYVGTWEISGGMLYLLRVAANPCSGKLDVPLNVLFPGQKEPIVATWFSGRLTVPQGKRIKAVHMGYMSQYERYILFEIERGKVVSRQQVTSLPNTRSRFGVD